MQRRVDRRILVRRRPLSLTVECMAHPHRGDRILERIARILDSGMVPAGQDHVDAEVPANTDELTHPHHPGTFKNVRTLDEENGCWAVLEIPETGFPTRPVVLPDTRLRDFLRSLQHRTHTDRRRVDGRVLDIEPASLLPSSATPARGKNRATLLVHIVREVVERAESILATEDEQVTSSLPVVKVLNPARVNTKKGRPHTSMLPHSGRMEASVQEFTERMHDVRIGLLAR